MDNNMMQLMMQMMNQQSQMMGMLMQQMAQPQPDPVQATQSAALSQSQVIADSNAAATASVQEVADLKAQIEQLKAQLSSAQEQVKSLTNQLKTSESQRMSLANEKVSLSSQLSELKGNIAAVEAYEGEDFNAKVERLNEMSGQDYYEDFIKNDADANNLDNQAKHELVQAFKDDQEARKNPIIDFETGEAETSNKVADFWAERQRLQKGVSRPKTATVKADEKFEGFGQRKDFGF